MVRPTRSLVVTKFDIWLCPTKCNLMKRKSYFAYYQGNLDSASCEAAGS
jgi:hypothetical protein